MVKTVKKAAITKKSAKKVVNKSTVKRNNIKPVVTSKVDYYPNRMTVAISALAGTLLVLFSLIAVLGSR